MTFFQNFPFHKHLIHPHTISEHPSPVFTFAIFNLKDFLTARRYSMNNQPRKKDTEMLQYEEAPIKSSYEEENENDAIKKLKHDSDAARKKEEIKNSTIGGF